MSRRQRAVSREIPPDPRFGSTTVTRFVNNVMRDGKRSVAERLFYDAMDIVEEKTGQPGMNIFQQALNNVKPVLEVRSRRVGGATYQVPMEVRPERRTSVAMKWSARYARERSEPAMAQRLAGELMAAARNEGSAVRRKDEMHRMAEANRAFAHYRW